MGLRNRSVAKRNIKEIKEELKQAKQQAKEVAEAGQQDDAGYGAAKYLIWVLIILATAFAVYQYFEAQMKNKLASAI